MRVTAIVLAAGSSRRFGSLKQEYELDGETLVARAMRIARDAGADRVIAVVQPGAFPEVDRVENPEYAEGIASSIRAGVRAAGESRVLFVLCDQTRVTSEHLRALIASDAPIVATGYAHIAGVPAVFAPRFFPELLKLRGDRGARSVIEAHRADVVVIPFEDAAFDLDTRP